MRRQHSHRDQENAGANGIEFAVRIGNTVTTKTFAISQDDGSAVLYQHPVLGNLTLVQVQETGHRMAEMDSATEPGTYRSGRLYDLAESYLEFCDTAGNESAPSDEGREKFKVFVAAQRAYLLCELVTMVTYQLAREKGCATNV